MFYVLEKPAGTFTPIDNHDVIVNGLVIPYNNLSVWDDGTRNAHSIYRVEVPATPAGKRLLDYSVKRVSGVVQVVPTYEDIVVPKPATPDVPMWAAKAALKATGKLADIDAYVQSVKDTDPAVFFAWTEGNFASRNSQFINSLAASFGMSDADIDAIFAAAKTISDAAG